MVTPKELAQDFYYENGKVLRKTTRSRWKAGTRAGYKEKKGYRRIKFKDGTTIAESRVVWCLCTGKWPEGEIDHINRVRDDNRFENLRVVDRFINTQNTKRKGYYKCGNKWRAVINANKKRYHLGVFDTALEAKKAYDKAKLILHSHGKTQINHSPT